MITVEEAKTYLRVDWMHTYKAEELIKTANTKHLFQKGSEAR